MQLKGYNEVLLQVIGIPEDKFCYRAKQRFPQLCESTQNIHAMCHEMYFFFVDIVKDFLF